MNFGKLEKIIDFLHKDSAVHVSLNLRLVILFILEKNL